MITKALIASLFSLVLCTAAGAQTPAKAPARQVMRGVKAGEFLVDRPTLINLGFEWMISGDDNRNSKVEVSYRKKGETAWKSAMPLMRIQHERSYWGNEAQDDHIINVIQPNMYAGSILDLEPGTTYETKFVLSDPDGGGATHLATVATRPEPKPAAGGRVLHVYPPGWKGPREPNSYIGLNCAYNYHCGGGDESFSDRPRVVAGDTILIHAGIYQSFQDIYARQSQTRPVEGTYYLFGQGTADKPIVIKAAGDGEVVFDGRNNFTLFNVANSKYNYFEGITFRNTEIAIQAGVQFFTGSTGLTVKNCRFENINQGINDSNAGSKDFYIADNTFIGRDDPNHLQGWNGDEFWNKFNFVDGQSFPVALKSYTAVRVYGQGHVVAYNYVANFHDGIDVETYGNPDGTDAVKGPFYPARQDWDHRTVSIDFYNNYMTNFHDNAFEIDGSMHNIRVMRNMMMNSASHPFCNQPSIGGPVYWIRNIAYNAPFGAVRMSSGAPGVWFLNNTIFSEFNAPTSANLHMFNNLILGMDAYTGNSLKPEDKPAVFQVNTYTNYDEVDYNGFRPFAGGKAAFIWNAPAPGMPQDYRELVGVIDGDGPAGTPVKSLVQHQYTTLAAYSADTKNDQHSILVDYGDFMNVKQLDARNLQTIQKLYDAKDMDFRLKAGSAPVDKGKVIPNITDGYTGSAPDLGALESGVPAPHYGPRTANAGTP